MKNSLNIQRIAALAFGAALLGGLLPASPVRAQDAAAPVATAEPTRPISLNLVNVPVRTALQTLFSAAGIRNYVIKSDVQGFANISVGDAPFNVALRQLLSSVNPPLAYTVENGSYIVSVQEAAPPPAPTINVPTQLSNAGAPGDTTAADGPKRFYRIPIDKYDAYYIATLLGAKGVIKVGTNEVIPAYDASQGGFGGGLGNRNGRNGQSGFGGSGLSAPVTSIGGGTSINNGGYGGRRGGYSGGGGDVFGGGGGFSTY